MTTIYISLLLVGIYKVNKETGGSAFEAMNVEILIEAQCLHGGCGTICCMLGLLILHESYFLLTFLTAVTRDGSGSLLLVYCIEDA